MIFKRVWRSCPAFGSVCNEIDGDLSAASIKTAEIQSIVDLTKDALKKESFGKGFLLDSITIDPTSVVNKLQTAAKATTTKPSGKDPQRSPH